MHNNEQFGTVCNNTFLCFLQAMLWQDIVDDKILMGIFESKNV